MSRKFNVSTTFEIDTETADRIAAQSLKQHYNYVLEDIDDFVLHQKGHPDDYEWKTKLKEALTIVLDYYCN